MTGGPFGSEREALAAADHTGLTGTGAIRNRDMLTRACWAARIEVGAFDARILSWLTGYEPATCAVVAGLITRAFEAGRAAAGGEHATLARVAAVLAGFDWEHDDRQYALEAIERIVLTGDAQ